MTQILVRIFKYKMAGSALEVCYLLDIWSKEGFEGTSKQTVTVWLKF